MDLSIKFTKKELVTAFRTKEILAAAQQVMELRGVEAATMDEIAAAAGVAKGTLYLYFQGREDLVQAIMSQVCETLLRDLEGIVESSSSPTEKLGAIVALLLKHLERERVWFPIYARDLLRGERGEKGRPRPYIHDLEEKFVALLTRFFAEGSDTGRFIQADPRLLAFLLRGLVRAVGYYQMLGKREDIVQEALPVLVTLLSSGLGRQPEATEAPAT
ncbi:MAG: TetR/AcrR family transcriptional regulator [Deltaproteobacteria bacterium]|nr:TetR/AcrR family transcriptional regulator [Deltaproteobacteria bacterium]